MADPEITALLDTLESEQEGAARESAATQLYEHVYADLHQLARAQLRRLRPGGTLQTTALVHEAFLRLVGTDRYNDRGHFFATSARAMRQILIDHARGKGSQKRGGDWQAIDLDKANLKVEEQADLILSIDGALRKLAALSPRWVQVVECRFFAGLSEPETAEALGISVATAQRDWTKAKLWLRRELSTGPSTSA